MSSNQSTGNVVAIRFQPVGKPYHFSAPNDKDLKTGDFVIVNTSRGREIGEVVQFVEGKEIHDGSLKPIERKATAQELVSRRLWQRRELEVLIDCRATASELGLTNVKFARAEFSFDGSRLTFHYNSEGDEKVDLGPLRKKMRSQHRKTRIQFRQIGPRDVAKIFGGIGACGLEERCCSMFLTEFSPISIRMAKAQGVSLNPQEITGMCGRLRCCLMYEYQQYVEAKKKLPKRKKRVITPRGEGKVVDTLPLKQAVIVQLDDDVRAEFSLEDIKPYEEYKALQEKANNECDKHENGGCNCGKGG
jgi:cell fate regulator YaaT (PSP1 superfamily)